jgi:hypothetical protein
MDRLRDNRRSRRRASHRFWLCVEIAEAFTITLAVILHRYDERALRAGIGSFNLLHR